LFKFHVFFKKVFFFSNVFHTSSVLPYDFCQFVSVLVLVCFYQERRRDTAFLFGLISEPIKKESTVVKYEHCEQAGAGFLCRA
jgi:hypothetical protein